MAGSVINTVLGGQVQLLQPVDGYRASIDPILLAAACHPTHDTKMADFGCGVGTIGLCLKHFEPNLNLTGYEIQPDLADLAMKNSINSHIRIRNENIEGVAENAYDHIVMNPPYYEEGANVPSPHGSIATAHTGRLDDWFAAARHGLVKGGYLSAILPATRFDDVRKLCRRHQFGQMQLMPIYPKFDLPAKRIIFQVRLNKTRETVIHAGLTLHSGAGRNYTDTAQAILNGQAKLDHFVKDFK